jgi:hypothetical protein
MKKNQPIYIYKLIYLFKNFLNSKIAPIYQESETFILNEIFKSNDNVCIYNYIKLMILLKKEQKLNCKVYSAKTTH